MFTSIIFYIFSFMLIISSLVVVLSRNPVYALLMLIFSFFNAAGLFVLLKAEFLAMVLVIVYVGAVAILFLFVVMLINIRDQEKSKIFTRSSIFAAFLLLILGIELFLLMYNDIEGIKPLIRDSNFLELSNSVSYFGQLFYNNYYYPFLVSSLILTVAMIGAIVIVHRENNHRNNRQDTFIQNIRSKEETVYKVKVDVEKGIK